jgi:uncharacterized glyoxalase superfamily metalloenzyme YdcJ
VTLGHLAREIRIDRSALRGYAAWAGRSEPDADAELRSALRDAHRIRADAGDGLSRWRYRSRRRRLDIEAHVEITDRAVIVRRIVVRGP